MTAVATRHDPLLNHNFIVSLLDSTSALAPAAPPALAGILDSAAGGFAECSGIEMTIQPEEYKEGGNNGATLKFAGRVTWTSVTLKRGITESAALWNWHFDFVEGRGKRRDGVIVLLDSTRKPVQAWFFRRGLPVKYSGPSLNATQNNVAIESIEIAHEGIHQIAGVGG